MPRIQEYDSQIGAAGPLGATSPNLELQGAVGKAIEGVGQDITQISSAIQKRNEQQETADIYSDFAGKRAELFERISQEEESGTLNADSIRQEYNTWAESQAGNYQTGSAKNYFKRQQARLDAAVTIKAASSQAQMNGKLVAEKVDVASRNDVSTIMSHPDQFEEVLGGAHEFLEQTAETEPYVKAHLGKFQIKIGEEYAKAAIEGTARQSPELAKQLLDKGAFNQYFNADDLNKQYQRVEQIQRASSAEFETRKKREKEDEDLQTENLRKGFLKKMVDGKFDVKDVIKSDLPEKDQEEMIRMAKTVATNKQQGDPQLETNLFMRTLLPDNDPNKISGMRDLMPYLQKGTLSPEGANKILKWQSNTPDGRNMSTGRKQMMDLIKDQLGSAPGLLPGMPSVKDPNGMYRVIQATHDLQDLEDQFAKEGKNPKALFDPSSSDYFGKRVPSYRPSPQQIMQDRANLISQSAFSGAQPTPTATPSNGGAANVDTPSGVPVPQAPPISERKLPAGTVIRKPGESPAAFLKRKREANQ